MAVAVLAPLLWLSVAYPLETGMFVIDRSATLLIHHGSPYLPAAQVTGWQSYDPYLPVMVLFGLPYAAGLAGLAGNSGVWIAVGTVAVLTAAFWIAMPHRSCASCRRIDSCMCMATLGGRGSIPGGGRTPALLMQHFLYFLPLPQGHGSFRPLFMFFH